MVFRFAGYHGRSAVIPKGSRQVAAWGGGELGPGLYCTPHRSAALLYGAASAQAHGCDRVTVSEVHYRTDARWVEPTPVPNHQQFERFPSFLGEPPHDVLVTASECARHRPLPSQYKVNPHRVACGDVILCNERECSVDEAFENTLPGQYQDVDENPEMVVAPIPGDGDCFFSAVAWHVKLSAQSRADWLHSPRDFPPVPPALSAEVRTEISAWLFKELQNPQHTSKYAQLWEMLTGNGQDTVQFGRSVEETVAGTSKPGEVWGDIQFHGRALTALYQRNVFVYYGAREPIVLKVDSDRALHPIVLRMSVQARHYDACSWGGPFRTNAGVKSNL